MGFTNNTFEPGPAPTGASGAGCGSEMGRQHGRANPSGRAAPLCFLTHDANLTLLQEIAPPSRPPKPRYDGASASFARAHH